MTASPTDCGGTGRGPRLWLDMLIAAAAALLTGCRTPRPDVWLAPSSDIVQHAQDAVHRMGVCVEMALGHKLERDIPPVAVLLRRCERQQDGLWVWTVAKDTFAGTCNSSVMVVGCSPDGREINDVWAHEALHWVLIHGLGIHGHDARFAGCAGGWGL